MRLDLLGGSGGARKPYGVSSLFVGHAHRSRLLRKALPLTATHCGGPLTWCSRIRALLVLLTLSISLLYVYLLYTTSPPGCGTSHPSYVHIHPKPQTTWGALRDYTSRTLLAFPSSWPVPRFSALLALSFDVPALPRPATLPSTRGHQSPVGGRRLARSCSFARRLAVDG